MVSKFSHPHTSSTSTKPLSISNQDCPLIWRWKELNDEFKMIKKVADKMKIEVFYMKQLSFGFNKSCSNKAEINWICVVLRAHKKLFTIHPFVWHNSLKCWILTIRQQDILDWWWNQDLWWYKLEPMALQNFPSTRRKTPKKWQSL